MPPNEATPFLTDPNKQEHHLESSITTIGRAVENDIVITNKRVSRAHAQIRRDGRHLFLEDQGSSNGTFLNEERLLKSTELRDNDRITIGDVNFIFHDPDTTSVDSPFPNLEVNTAAGIVHVDRKAVSLSPKEYALLIYLHENNGQVCSKDDIGRAVWPEYESGGIFDYQIENLVRRLRTRIEYEPNSPQLLVTIRGLGYKLTTKE